MLAAPQKAHSVQPSHSPGLVYLRFLAYQYTHGGITSVTDPGKLPQLYWAFWHESRRLVTTFGVLKGAQLFRLEYTTLLYPSTKVDCLSKNHLNLKCVKTTKKNVHPRHSYKDVPDMPPHRARRRAIL